MGATDLCFSGRLKREDCNRTKHDSYFSKWKILVGPSDWEDYSRGKEGVTRYRIHNLPTSSGPGLYELGIAVLPDSGLRREVGKLDPSRIVVVYLGQAGNVRIRLQGYGRSGNHLGKSYSSDHTNANKDVLNQKGSSLFDEIFFRGCSILFRWASVENKSNAEKMEACLLERFDYAWNKGQNGSARPTDVLHKLNKLDSTFVWFPNITRKIINLSQKPVGVKIKARKPPSLDNNCTSQVNESKKIIPQIFSFMKSRPRLVSVKSSPADDLRDSKVNLPVNGYLLSICGVTLNDGTFCEKVAVSGRVRCEQHKWMKTKGKSMANLKSSYLHDTCTPSHDPGFQDETFSMCGVELGNGKLCENQPVARRKRCGEHKGLRVNSPVPKVR